VVIGGTVRPVSQQTTTLDAATFDRYDLLSVNSSGTVVVTKGTEERRVPALPANSVPIAICLIETGQTALPADRIYDSRMDALRLSVLNIDGDKNWNGKSITNIGALGVVGNATLDAALWTPYAQLVAIPAPDAGLIIYQNNTVVSFIGGAPVLKKTITVPAKYTIAGTVLVEFNHYGDAGATYLYHNGSSVGSVSFTNTTTVTVEDVDAGDTLEIWLSSNNADRSYNSTFKAYALERPLSEGEAW